MNKHQLLKQYFGYDEFREGQETLIDSILAGRDTLGIMPTGAGKSLCFQIPALMFDGITPVISPLISLMKDQVKALNEAGIHAAFLNSSLTTAQYYKALDYAAQGRYPIIYVAPERLLTDEFLNFALHVNISMIAVDEAHCVSQWGQDFRPSYLKIVEFIQQLPKRPVISAFTATATKEVRDDIIDILMLEEPTVLTTGFDRPNLYFSVQSPKDPYATMVNFIETHPGDSGIIYCLTRKTVEEVCDKLHADGFSVTRYHAGLSDVERRENQDEFIYDQAKIMVATNAFGMGIDKSNVRYVVHYNMPKNMESYYQEAGRAGRDGEPADCLLLYRGQDVVTNQFFIDNNQDNQELDPMNRRIVMERDRERLKKMTYYCFTNDCLRSYILRYFGEYGSNYCGNCSNCLTQFETVDVTAEAQTLIGTAAFCRGRYGTTVIIDTVRGANTAKIRQYGMNESPYYGKLAGVLVPRVRQILNQLVMEGYLSVTNDEYAQVKLTEMSQEILSGRESFLMKMAKEIEHPAKGKKSSQKGRGTGANTGDLWSEADEELFEKLRTLRMEIARKEKVPPYIVFSDKTLAHMSIIKPVTKEAMLTVSGVGEFKYKKYGEKFLECIRDAEGLVKNAGEEHDRNAMAEDIWTDLASSEDLSQSRKKADKSADKKEKSTAQSQTSRDKKIKDTVKPGRGKSDFAMTSEPAEQVYYSERISLSDFVAHLNELRDEKTMKRLTIKAVEEELLSREYFGVKYAKGRPIRTLTPKGMDFGIEAEFRYSEKGNEYEVFYYTEKAQRGIVEWLESCAEAED